MMAKRKRSSLLLLGVMVLPVGEAHNAFAAGQTLEEVVVTARKREESLVDVPVSISAITGDQITTSGLANLEDLSPSVPNFSFAEAVSGNDQVFVRGLGSGVNSGFENAVGQVINGFFFGRSRYGRAAFLDLKQIEVLKGPQGALIGKNTTAGAINITTAMPTNEFEGYVQGTYEFEADEGYTVEGAVSGPFSDSVRGRLAFKTEDRDGWMHNVSNGVDSVERDDITVRGLLDIDITDTLTANLLYQYGDSERVGRNREIINCSAAAEALFAPSGLEDCHLNYRIAPNRVENGVQKDEINDTEFELGGLTLNWDLGAVTLTSLTGFSGYDSEDTWDGDQTPLTGTITTIAEDFDQWSQELRVASNGDGALSYIAGVYYLHTEQETNFRVNLLGPARTRVLNTDQESDTVSAFGQLTWEITENWDITGGLRYTSEDKEASHQQYPAIVLTQTPLVPVPAGGPFTNVHNVKADRSESDLSPNVVLRWRPTDDAMLYASASKGFKGGGFDHFMDAPQATALDDFQFEEEEVTAYELGGKFTLAGGAAQLNVALFRSEFDDLQVSSLIPGDTVFKVGNAATAITQGLEVDLTWLVTENFKLFVAGAYLDAEYDEFENGPCYALQTTGCTVTPTGNIQDLSGENLQYAPTTSFTINGEYTWQVANDYDLSLFVQVYYTDEFQTATDNDPNTIQNSYSKIDATLSFGPQDGRWDVALIGRNLNDKLTTNFRNDLTGNAAFTGSYIAFVESPFALSLKATMKF